jgi:uncharacterized protein (TIGR03067 family)
MKRAVSLAAGGLLLALLVTRADDRPAAKRDGEEIQATGKKADDSKPGDADKLVGTWQGYVVTGRGEDPNNGPLKLELVITSDKIRAKDLRSGESLGEGPYKLGPDKTLKELDATGKVKERPSTTYLGIYELEGDTLKWCVSNGGKDRPTELATRRGKYLMVLKRQKRRS